MPFDFKKEEKALYQPGKRPAVIVVPTMNYLAVRGHGDPNEAGGDFQQAIAILYAVAYTIKMSKKGSHETPGYFDFVVPPLEGYWWQDGVKGVECEHKDTFNFIAMIRMPDFVDRRAFNWALQTASKKKDLALSRLEFLPQHEGLCVQALHVGPYDDEPATVDKIHSFMEKEGLVVDINDQRHHHEIYLSDPRRAKPDKMKTVIRIPVKKS